MTDRELQTVIAAIAPADWEMMAAAQKRQAELAKPPGSLGALEEISVRLAGITGQVCPRIRRCRVTVFAGDNGVTAEGVSCAPISVTQRQCINMTRHQTGMSALCATFGDDVQVVDVGVALPLPYEKIIDRRIRNGTANLYRESAMTRRECLRAISVGLEMAERAGADGVSVWGIGEMGIGNTTTSSAVLAALTGTPVEQVTGRGGGLTDEGFALKKKILEGALVLHHPDPADVVGVIAAVGGLDIAAMTGAYLGCARERIPAAVDGFISIVAALCAVRLCPAVRDYLFLSHASYELGYRIAAGELGLQPCLNLNMRLGEGSGCPLLFRILEGACGVMSGMATFSEAAICDDYLEDIRKSDSFTVEK